MIKLLSYKVMTETQEKKKYTVVEAERIAPKECWAAEYTEDERLQAIAESNRKHGLELLEKQSEKIRECFKPKDKDGNISLADASYNYALSLALFVIDRSKAQVEGHKI